MIDKIKPGTHTIILTRDENGVVAFRHETEGHPLYWYELIGLLEMHKQDLIVMSRLKAREIRKEARQDSEQQFPKGDDK